MTEFAATDADLSFLMSLGIAVGSSHCRLNHFDGESVVVSVNHNHYTAVAVGTMPIIAVLYAQSEIVSP